MFLGSLIAWSHREILMNEISKSIYKSLNEFNMAFIKWFGYAIYAIFAKIVRLPLYLFELPKYKQRVEKNINKLLKNVNYFFFLILRINDHVNTIEVRSMV